ncbi:hypothetical protein [Jannaschia donghaensis]|uniref:Uncharacterized protein n=1 Tax=Jannaschia donghaensis TaxID=420998 RepID=A0A0M6YGF5_9RHOB|nr:hypothetical protein [Jannaschia donghaensis]CTQ48859.1 hypothetical protein JDO7802_00867 [Jannaschia donghaensis]
MDQTFADRVARVEAIAAERAAITAEERANRPRRQSRHAKAQTAGNGIRDNEAWPIIALPICFAVGLLCVLISRVTVFHFIVPNADLVTQIEAVISVYWVPLILAVVLGFIADNLLAAGMIGQAATTAGFTLMMWYEGELAYRLPAVWTWLYDAQHAAYMGGVAPVL